MSGMRRLSLTKEENCSLVNELYAEEPKPSSGITLSSKELNFSVSLPLLQSNDGTRFIDIRKLTDLTGLYTYDPGFSCTSYCCSKITHIDGAKGILQYRGYDIHDLTENCSYLEVCYLLIFGRLPSKEELDCFENEVLDEMFVHEKIKDLYKSFEKDAHPMAIMVGVVGALSAFMRKAEETNFENQRFTTAVQIISKMPVLAAIAFRTSRGLPLVEVDRKYGYVENFLRMMFKSPTSEWTVDPKIIKIMEKLLILHADHEQNASACTVRIASSSLANPYVCIAAGIASLWGPAHGGASEAAINSLEKMGSPENIPSFLESVKAKREKLMGFGHRIYKSYDPRADIVKKAVNDITALFGETDDKDILSVALKLEETALKDKYFTDRKLFPNVDFYTGIIYKTIGIPKDMFTVMFAVGRAVGWITQLNESRIEQPKIGRPRQIYMGYLNRKFEPIEKREKKKFEVVIPKHSELFKIPFHK